MNISLETGVPIVLKFVSSNSITVSQDSNISQLLILVSLRRSNVFQEKNYLDTIVFTERKNRVILT